MSLKKIGLFYGSSTCYTEMAAEKIRDQIGVDRVELFNVADDDISLTAEFSCLIMGIPTWDYGELQEDWEAIWDELDNLELEGKKIALFGLGDQIGYPQWFLDALGYLHDKLVLQGASMIGYWPIDGFKFEESKALTTDKKYFVGLALDDENEFDLSAERIAKWCDLILEKFDA